ncbi:unnamed protein product [Arctogadus glacialis]
MDLMRTTQPFEPVTRGCDLAKQREIYLTNFSACFIYRPYSGTVAARSRTHNSTVQLNVSDMEEWGPEN